MFRFFSRRRDYERLVIWKLDAIVVALRNQRAEIAQLRMEHMASMRDIIDRINQQETMIDGLGVLIQELKQKIADATTNVPAEVQAQIDEAFAELDQNTGKLASALGTTPSGDPAPVGDQGGASSGGDGGTVDATTGQPADPEEPNAA